MGDEAMKLAKLIVAVAMLAACSSDSTGPSGSCQSGGTRVCMGAASFNPSTLTVTAGATVEWVDGSGLAHTVISAPGSGETFNHTVSAGGSVSRTFNTAGTYDYYCSIHGSPTSGMRGTIVVNP